MPKGVRLVFNRNAFREIRLQPKVQDNMFERAERIAEACGEGFTAVRTAKPRNRARAAVVTTSIEAINRNARENTLVNNLDAGRGDG